MGADLWGPTQNEKARIGEAFERADDFVALKVVSFHTGQWRDLPVRTATTQVVESWKGEHGAGDAVELVAEPDFPLYGSGLSLAEGDIWVLPLGDDAPHIVGGCQGHWSWQDFQPYVAYVEKLARRKRAHDAKRTTSMPAPAR